MFDINLDPMRHFFTNSIYGDGSRYTGHLITSKQKSHLNILKIGEKVAGIKQGVGCIVFANGSLFQGYFEDNQPKVGRYFMSNGDVYEGILKHFGILKYQHFVGQMYNFKPHGYGMLSRDQNAVFKGNFVNGVFNQIDEADSVNECSEGTLFPT